MTMTPEEACRIFDPADGCDDEFEEDRDPDDRDDHNSEDPLR